MRRCVCRLELAPWSQNKLAHMHARTHLHGRICANEQAHTSFVLSSSPSEKAYVLLIQNPIFADVMSEWQKWLSRYCISSCHVFLLLYHIMHVCRCVGLLICERLFAGFLLPVRMDIIAGQIQFEFYVSPHDAFAHAYVQEQAHALAHLSSSSDRAGCLKSCR